MTHFNFKKGLQEFGNKGKTAVFKELKQLHDKGAVEPVRNLTRKQKSEALRYLMYLNRKKTGRVKVVQTMGLKNNIAKISFLSYRTTNTYYHNN